MTRAAASAAAGLRKERLGWKPNAPDARDFDEQRLGLASSALPENATHMLGLHEELDQHRTNSCTGHGLVQNAVISERAAYRRAHPEVSFADVRARFRVGSPYAPYWGGRRMEHPAKRGNVRVQDIGAFPRLVTKYASLYGIPEFDDWNPPIEQINRKPPPTAFVRAMRRSGIKFFYIRGTGAARIQAVRAAIVADKPIGFGTGVGLEMSGIRGPRVLGVPATIVGLHYMCIVAYRRAASGSGYEFGVVQSYGKHYGERHHGVGGIFWITEEYLVWTLTGDLEIIDDWEALRDARS